MCHALICERFKNTVGISNIVGKTRTAMVTKPDVTNKSVSIPRREIFLSSDDIYAPAISNTIRMMGPSY